MTTLITIALTAIALGVGLLCILSYNIYLSNEKNSRLLRDIRQFQINPRTRMSTVQMRSGPVTEEKQVERLGRASTARRVVVGGDPDSQLHGNLSRPYAYSEEDDDE